MSPVCTLLGGTTEDATFSNGGRAVPLAGLSAACPRDNFGREEDYSDSVRATNVSLCEGGHDEWPATTMPHAFPLEFF